MKLINLRHLWRRCGIRLSHKIHTWSKVGDTVLLRNMTTESKMYEVLQRLNTVVFVVLAECSGRTLGNSGVRRRVLGLEVQSSEQAL